MVKIKVFIHLNPTIVTKDKSTLRRKERCGSMLQKLKLVSSSGHDGVGLLVDDYSFEATEFSLSWI